MWDEFIKQEIGNGQTDKICDFFIGITCMANYGTNRVYRIDDIDFLTTPMSPFPNQEFTNYEEYFMKKYGVPKLKYPDQFTLVHKNRKAEVSSDGKKNLRVETVYLVPELMLPTGPNEALKGDRRLLEDLPEHGKKNPNTRFGEIGGLITSINANEDGKSTFHFKICPKENTVVGYRLEQPIIKAGKSKILHDGDRYQLSELADCVAIDNWILVCDYKMKMIMKQLSKI